MNRVIIAGGRDFADYELLRSKCDEILKNLADVQIVSGNSNGADLLGERYASERGYSLSVFKADWDKFGKAAGPKRNEEMARYATHLIAFGDGISRGTKDMITRAEIANLKARIIRY